MSVEDKAVVEAHTDHSLIEQMAIISDIWNPEIYEQYTAMFFRKYPNAPKVSPVRWVQQ